MSGASEPGSLGAGGEAIGSTVEESLVTILLVASRLVEADEEVDVLSARREIRA
jgi:hypothetical protein